MDNEVTTGESNYSRQIVQSVHYWSEGLLSLRTSRDEAFRFSAGHYARLGLTGSDQGMVWRPLSMVSAPEDGSLEFLVKLVPGGDFSEALASVSAGDHVAIDRRCFGFLTVRAVKSAEVLWLLSSGTGLGPFISMVRAARSLDSFERVIIVHSVRHEAELAYREELEALAVGHVPPIQYLPVVTRAKDGSALGARIPAMIESGALQQAAQAPLDADRSSVMVCGNPALCADMRALLNARGFRTSRRGVAGNMAFEKYW